MPDGIRIQKNAHHDSLHLLTADHVRVSRSSSPSLDFGLVSSESPDLNHAFSQGRDLSVSRVSKPGHSEPQSWSARQARETHHLQPYGAITVARSQIPAATRLKSRVAPCFTLWIPRSHCNLYPSPRPLHSNLPSSVSQIRDRT